MLLHLFILAARCCFTPPTASSWLHCMAVSGRRIDPPFMDEGGGGISSSQTTLYIYRKKEERKRVSWEKRKQLHLSSFACRIRYDDDAASHVLALVQRGDTSAEQRRRSIKVSTTGMTTAQSPVFFYLKHLLPHVQLTWLRQKGLIGHQINKFMQCADTIARGLVSLCEKKMFYFYFGGRHNLKDPLKSRQKTTFTS